MIQHVQIFEKDGSSKIHKVSYLENEQHGQKVLSEARCAKKRIVCTCNKVTNPVLYTRQSGAKLILCRNPDSGPDHKCGCDDYEEHKSKSGRRNYSKEAITETIDGYTIQLGVALCQANKAVQDDGLLPETPNAITGHSYRRLGLYGLLHFLWTRANLHMWRWEETRTWGEVSRRLATQVAKISIGSSDLTDKLILPRTSNSAEIEKHFTEIKPITAIVTRRDFRIFIGHLLMVEDRGKMMQLTAEDMSGKDKLWVSKPIWDHALSASSHHGLRAAVAIIDRKTSVQRVVMIGRVETNKNGYRVFIDLRLMVTSKDFIPVDSTYEAQIADLLIADDRRFEKPLMYDSDDEVFPDFVLTDVHPNVPMEIWGITNNAKYDQRKNKKQEYYQTIGGAWEWNAGAKEQIPSFPLMAQS